MTSEITKASYILLHHISSEQLLQIQLKDEKITSHREKVKKLEDDKKKFIVQLIDYEELKSENERLKKQIKERQI